MHSDATFWDLHCSINDAMGWEDMHLHVFQIGAERRTMEIGIPMEDDDSETEAAMQADWNVSVATYLSLVAHC